MWLEQEVGSSETTWWDLCEYRKRGESGVWGRSKQKPEECTGAAQKPSDKLHVSLCSPLSACSHVWLCDSVDCSPPSSYVHGVFQARILEWIAISSSRGSSHPRDQTLISCVSCIGRQILLPLSYLGSLSSLDTILNELKMGLKHY